MANGSKYPNFDDNLKALVDGEAIPHTDPGDMDDSVKQAISDLSPDEIETLKRIAKTTDSHLFVHDKNNKGRIIAMGL